MRATGERLDVERLRVLPVDPVADAAQPREIAQVLVRGGSASHLCILSRHAVSIPAWTAAEADQWAIDLHVPGGLGALRPSDPENRQQGQA
jgi:hypothetical protein